MISLKNRILYEKIALIQRLIFVLTLCIGPYNTLLAYNFKTIGIRDGLSQLSVMAIHQDHFGRMWFGTEEGLNVFDGNHFQILHSNENILDKSGSAIDFLGNSNYPIVEDKYGNLFFRSDNSLIKYNIHTLNFSHISHKGFFTLTSHEGEIWMAIYNSIYKVQGDTLQLVYKMERPADIKCMYVREHILWLGTEKNLFRIDLKNKTQESVLKACVWSIYEDSGRQLWVATRRNGVFRVNNEEEVESIHFFEDEQVNRIPDEVRCFVEDNNGNLWIGTFNGLIRYNLKTHSSIRYTTHDGLSHNSVYSLYLDNNENIWVGTYYGGVNYFNSNENTFIYFLRDELKASFIGSMTEDNDNNIWISSEGEGLKCYNPSTGKFTDYSIQWTVDGYTTTHPNIKTLCFDKENNMLYIGTTTGGLCRYSIKNHTFKHYNQDKNIYKMLGSSMNKICKYGDYLYLQVRRGIFKMHIPTETISPLAEERNYHNKWIRTFTSDSKGNLWIAGYNDLHRFNLLNDDNSYVFKNSIDVLGRYPITCITESPKGDIFVGTRGSGIYKYNDNESFVSIDERLSDVFCYDINFSKNGKMLILTDKGVYVKNNMDETLQFISLKEYLAPLKAINMGCKIYVANDSTIYLGGTNGMVAYSEEKLRNHINMFDIYISSLKVNNKILNPSLRCIQLKEKSYDITLKLGTTDFSHVLTNEKYMFMLEGYDKEWHETNKSQIDYYHLPAGNYKLIIKNGNTTRHIGDSTICLYIENGYRNSFWWKIGGLVVVLVVSVVSVWVWSIHLQRKKSGEEPTLLDVEKKDVSESLSLENINMFLEEFQKNINHKISDSILFVYLQHNKGDLYYMVNKSLLLDLLSKLVQYILTYINREQNNIEVTTCMRNEKLAISIADYVGGPIHEEEFAALRLICKNQSEDISAATYQLSREIRADEEKLKDLCVKNHAVIEMEYNGDYAMIITVVVDNANTDEETSAETANCWVTADHEQADRGLEAEGYFIKQVDQIILNNISDESFNVSDIVSSLYVNRTSFYKKFKEETGLSPNEYLNNFRLSYARDLFVEHPDFQVADVAYKVGFSSPRYLGRCFKKRYGISPIAYRKMRLENNKEISES